MITYYILKNHFVQLHIYYILKICIFYFSYLFYADWLETTSLTNWCQPFTQKLTKNLNFMYPYEKGASLIKRERKQDIILNATLRVKKALQRSIIKRHYFIVLY